MNDENIKKKNDALELLRQSFGPHIPNNFSGAFCLPALTKPHVEYKPDEFVNNEDKNICAECGGYIPIGEVTTPLPNAALCHGFKGILDGDYKNFAVSYNDAYDTWVKNGMPVYDDGSNLSKWGDPIHQEVDNPDSNIVNTNSEIDMPLVDPTPCDNSITPESLNWV